MNLNTFNEFRHQVYACFESAADALFEVADALLTEVSARSLIELSLSPCFRRRWPSLYEALEDGRINHEQLRSVLVQAAEELQEGKRIWLGVDASSIARPQSPTAQDRSSLYVPNLPESDKPVTVGWKFSSVVVLPQVVSSATFVLSTQRIPTTQTDAQVAAAQLEALLPLFGQRVVLVGDRLYGSAAFVRLGAGLACDQLLRLQRHRVLYRPAPPRTGKRGAPCKDGTRFVCKDATTHGSADETWQGCDEQGHQVQVECWHHLHFRQAREIEVSVLRVTRAAARETARDPRVSWFVWHGSPSVPLDEIADGYRRRYAQEHGYRLDKQALLWDRPRLRTPEQFERWSQLVGLVHNQLVLAQAVVEVERRPWEHRQRRASLQQVRRAMLRIVARLGTPALPPKPRGKSPGRAQGATVKAASRFEVVRKVKKAATEAKTSSKKAKTTS